jgi:enoyl-CoA hydratase
MGAHDVVITQHRDGDVAVIEIDRHERRNALDTAHCDDLRAALTEQARAEQARAEPALQAARVIVVTGAGSSFCAGADLAAAYDAAFRDSLYAMLAAVTGVTVPVIAAVNGPAIGAGAQLALACDLRVAAPEATFAIPTARLGIAVNPWTVRRLALLAGTELAKDFDACWASDDAAEGQRARAAKRPPRFRGR